MRSGLKQFSGFVSDLSARARDTDAQELAEWGVGQLSDTLGFDCGWYGWAQLESSEVHIHAQCSFNLSDCFYRSWCEMSGQDLLAAALLENPETTAVYDRRGKTQTDGMISLADQYGLNKMATAMHLRADRTTSFFLSSYRAGQHSKAWSVAELDYLQCAVNQLSAAMTQSTVPSEASVLSEREHSMIVNEHGIVILGLARAIELWGSLWPEWCDDRLPAPLCDLINTPGEHKLVDRQLVVYSEPAPGINTMKLRKLELRHLTEFDLLTRREQQVAALLADGLSHKQAARVLGVAPATVRNQTRSIYSKMGVNSRAELALKVRSRS